ncbi:MAG: gliding motility-associated C-terminal domain-containing protein [Bacteroidetes bacterium]|nr:gliding motility-associated C-terminal domain-containing protein [Bacteroidota bacterium]
MRKILLVAALVCLYSNNLFAAYGQVTTTSGVQVVNGITVTVSTPAGRTNPAPATVCGYGPYFIGAGTGNPPGGYHYDFTPTDKVTHLRISVGDLHREDTIYVMINGSFFPITPAMVALGACGSTVPTLAGGKVVSTAPVSVVTSAVITIPYGPSFIQSVEVLHDNLYTGGTGGSTYKFEFNVDSCNQPFVVTADSACRTRDLNLHSTVYPNTTYSWSSTATAITSNPFSGNANPTIASLTLPGHNGTYTVTATRGACTYTGSVVINVDNTPIPVTMSYKGPKCRGDVDTVTGVSSLTSGGTYWFGLPDGSWVAGSALLPGKNGVILNNIQPADAGVYKGVAVSTYGCPSDTGQITVSLNPIVKADFTADNKLGCSSDSIQFTDGSIGNNIWYWDFGDGNTLSGTNPSIHANPLHVYTAQGTYNVKLKIANNRCADSLTKVVSLTHPLTADFSMDDDSICQGDSIQFTNLSTFTPATIPTYEWFFKDGSPINTSFGPKHIFNLYGVYNIDMVITDYMGCKRKATKVLVVDSIGSASFFTDTVICAGQNIKFLGDYSTIGGTFARWDFADGHTINDLFTIEHAFDKPGVFNVQLTAHYRVCPDTNYHQNIYVKPFPIVDAGPDTVMCPGGQPVMINTNVTAAGPGVKLLWNTETKDTTGFIIAHHPGTYAVTANLDGCQSTDTVVVRKNCYIDIPNVFTPDGDGYNDYFLPRQLLSKNLTKFSMVIYNRWGQKVFETTTLDGRGWDGKFNDKPQPEGVYVYTIQASFANNTNENYTGNVTLIR